MDDQFTIAMGAYVIVQVQIHDPVLYEEYKSLTPAAIRSYDGRFVVRGGEPVVLEGSWDPGRLVILEFPSVERAKAWWNSPEYSKAREIRQRAATTRMIIMDGYAG